MRRSLAQVRAQKGPLMRSYLHNIGAENTPDCPLCEQEEHSAQHLFRCPRMPTELTPDSLWSQPLQAAELIKRWEEALAEVEEV